MKRKSFLVPVILFLVVSNSHAKVSDTQDLKFKEEEIARLEETFDVSKESTDIFYETVLRLAALYSETGQSDKSVSVLRDALKKRESIFGREDKIYAAIIEDLIKYSDLINSEADLDLRNALLAYYQNDLESNSRSLLQLAKMTAQRLNSADQTQDATDFLFRAVDIAESSYGADDKRTLPFYLAIKEHYEKMNNKKGLLGVLNKVRLSLESQGIEKSVNELIPIYEQMITLCEELNKQAKAGRIRDRLSYAKQFK